MARVLRWAATAGKRANEETQAADVPRTLGLIAVALGGALLLGAGLGGHALLDPDEAKHAEVAREMLVAGRWIEPIVNFEPYHHKPSLLYLLVGAGYRLFGVSELGARFVPAAAAWLTLVVTFAYAARRGVGEGLLAALLLGACGFFVAVGRFTNFDAPLTFFLTGAVLSAARLTVDPSKRSCAYSFYACTALAVLIKGPAALVLAGAPVVLALTRGDLAIEDLAWKRGLLLGAAIVGAWAIPALVFAPRYVADFLWVHNVERYLASPGADLFHPKPAWFYLPVLFGALLPWSPLLPHVYADVFRGPDRRRSERLLAEFALCVVVFFSLSSGKLATYILPAVPVLALLTAEVVADDARNDPWAARNWVTVAGAACALLVVVTLAVVRREAPDLAQLAWLVVPVSAAGAFVVVAGRRLTTVQALVTCSAGMLATVVVLHAFGGEAVERHASDKDLARVAAKQPAPRNVIAYRVRPFSFQFYTGWPLSYHDPLDEVRKILYSPGPTLVLTETRWAAHLEDLAPGVTLRELARNPRHALYRAEAP
jgi:dolichol-phosphate mannosyltransferase